MAAIRHCVLVAVGCLLAITHPAGTEAAELCQAGSEATGTGRSLRGRWYSCGEGYCQCQEDRADCSRRRLPYIPPMPASITFLDLSHNAIGDINDGDYFLNITGIKDLNLSFNDIENVNSAAFQNLTNMSHLDLRNNRLTCSALSNVLSICTVQNLIVSEGTRCEGFLYITVKGGDKPRLQELDISGCDSFYPSSIFYMHNKEFDWHLSFSGLRHLNMAWTMNLAFDEALYKLLRQFDYLTHVDMSGHRISCAGMQALLSIPTLEVLILRSARECRSFCYKDDGIHESQLKELDVGGLDPFYLFDLTCLASLKRLERLNLENTGDPYGRDPGPVPDFRALYNIPSLTFLDLSGNYLSCENLQIVLKINTLTHLVLRHATSCVVQDINTVKLFWLSPNLRTLDLGGNNFLSLTFFFTSSELWNNIQPPSNSSMFPSNLQVLNMTGNRLTSVPCIFSMTEGELGLLPNTCKMLSLLNLDVSENRLARLSPFVSCVRYVKALNVRRNYLSFEYPDFNISTFQSLETLDASEQSQTEGVVNIISSKSFNNPSLKSLILSDNHLLFNKEKFVAADCFMGCPSLTGLFLAGNDFSGVSESLFRRLFGTLVRLRSLSLRSTGLGFLTPTMFQDLVSLQSLDLSHNNLFLLPDDAFQSLLSLKAIDLSFNKMSVVQESAFSLATRQRLECIDLRDNPFMCSCQVLRFQKWLVSRHTVFAGSLCQYKCGNLPEKTVESFFLPEQACVLSQEASQFTIATVSLILIGMSLVTFLYRYRWHLRLIIFEAFHGGDRRLQHLRENVFQYDVFVSYNSEDYAWVRRRLMPQLEEDMGLRLCIHQRDFMLGCPIVENVMGSVQASKKMLMVFSRAFAKSEWCQFELQLCLTHAMETEDVLVVVLLEHIPLREITPAMMAVMKTTTYIEWADEVEARESFWRRMGLALHELLPVV